MASGQPGARRRGESWRAAVTAVAAECDPSGTAVTPRGGVPLRGVSAGALGCHRDTAAALDGELRGLPIEYPVHHQRPISQQSTPGTARHQLAFRKQSRLAPPSLAHPSAVDLGRLRRASLPCPLTTPAPRASTTGSLGPPSWPAPLERRGVAVVTCPLRPGPEPGWPRPPRSRTLVPLRRADCCSPPATAPGALEARCRPCPCRAGTRCRAQRLAIRSSTGRHSWAARRVVVLALMGSATCRPRSCT